MSLGSGPPPHIAGIALVTGNVIISGKNGIPGTTCYVLTSPDVVLPVASWDFVATNTFDSFGNFSFTDTVAPGDPQRFYRIQLP